MRIKIWIVEESSDGGCFWHPYIGGYALRQSTAQKRAIRLNHFCQTLREDNSMRGHLYRAMGYVSELDDLKNINFPEKGEKQ